MDHRLDLTPSAINGDAKAHANRLVTALTAALIAPMMVSSIDRKAWLTRVLAMIGIILFCISPVLVVATTVWVIANITSVDNNTGFWFLSTIALGMASFAPIAVLIGTAREFGKSMRIDVASNCKSRDEQTWLRLEERLNAYRDELRQTSLRDSDV